jgi:hypothetical protein
MGAGATLNFPSGGDLGELPSLKMHPFNLDFDVCTESLSSIVSKLRGRPIAESERIRVEEKIKSEIAGAKRRADLFGAVAVDKSQQRQRELEEREARVSEQERLRTAELQAERKRREDAEEKLRIAQQQQGSPSPAPSAIGKRVALVIGNAAYKLNRPGN